MLQSINIRAIRRPAAALWLLAGVAACSSTPSTGPTGGTGPASVTVSSGDGQTAPPGSALPIRPAVIVRDASGNPVTGVAVTFAVDSGGGSLSANSATTGSDGVATAGIWTLGSGAGTNVLSAKTSTLAAIRFHAQAFGADARPIFAAATVGAGGGTLVYNKPGDALNGLTITVPAAAFPVTTTWTVTADSSLVVPLAAGVSQVGPVLVVGNGQGFADSLMTLTMPLSLASTDAVAPFYYDPVSHTLEGIPLVERTATSATLATLHFSGDLIAAPGHENVTASLRSRSSARFGAVYIVWGRAAAADLVGTWASGFQVGVDNWEFPNFGDYVAPTGECEGMSITEIFYYYYKKGNGRPLYHQYDSVLANPWDNIQGIRYTGSVQGDYATRFLGGINQALALSTMGAARNANLANLTETWILLTLKATQQPVLVALYGPGVAHAVVAFSATSDGTTTSVLIADPNVPTTARTMTFTNMGVLTPFPFSANANANSAVKMVTFGVALGVTAQVPLPFLNGRWQDFVNGTSGSDRYPPGDIFEWHDALNDVWRPLPDTIRTTDLTVQVRARCPGCSVPFIGADPADRVDNLLFNESGTTLLAEDPVAQTCCGIKPYALLDRGPHGYYAVARAPSPSDSMQGRLGFIDGRKLAVIFAPMSIYEEENVYPGEVNDYIVSVAGAHLPGYQYVWKFGDGTPDQKVVGDTITTHTYAATGTYTVSVTMLDPAGVLAGTASQVVKVTTPSFAWKFTSAGAAAVTLAGGGVGPTPGDTAVRDTVTAILAHLSAAPGDHRIFMLDSLNCHQIWLERFAPGQANDTAPVPNAIVLLLGTEQTATCAPAGYNSSVTVGTLGAGPLLGSLTPQNPTVDSYFSGTRITATMSGTTLTGSFVWIVYYNGGVGSYTVQFQATQVLPKPGP